MLQNYVTIVLRNLLRHKTFSLINILGLATGMAVTLLIVLYVAHEYSYDHFHQKGGRIVRAEFKHQAGNESYSVPWMSYRFGEAVKNACPEVEDFARFKEPGFGSKLVQSDSQHKFFEPEFAFADEGFLRVFTFDFLQGDPKTALSRPFTVLLTEQTARKYFGDAHPIGKTLLYDKQYTFEVVGILRNLPPNSSIQFDFLADLSSYRSIERKIYEKFMSAQEMDKQFERVGASGGYSTYFLLHPQALASRVAQKIPSLLTIDDKIKSSHASYILDPLFDLHFNSLLPSARQAVTIFSVVAILILALALINYINLTTARSTSRAKEVGIRKVAGAARKSLIIQFYLESSLCVSLAFSLSVIIFILLQPLFFQILQFSVDESFLKSPYFLVPTFIFYIICIILSGSYPALLLSGFAPVEVLKGRFSPTGNAAWIRKGLTVFQFAVSIALIIGSILIKGQLNLFMQKDTGLDRERVAVVHLDIEDGLDKYYKAIREEIRQIRGVEHITASSLVMYGRYGNIWSIKSPDSIKDVSVHYFAVDEEFIPALGLKWAIPPQRGQALVTKDQMVINEMAANQLGIHAGNYQQRIDVGEGISKNVIGVLKDFNYATLAREIKPMALSIAPDSVYRDYLYIKLSQYASIPETIGAIGQVYNRYKTDKPFDYTFLDDTYRKQYENQISTAKIMFAFTAFAIIIACMGLFGLATFTAEQRTKEIGIRKVLGASVSQIVAMLSKDLLKLIAVAFVISTPIAWYFMHKWLEDFAYRIDIEWWVFGLAGVVALFIALFTVSFQAIKAALSNPVKSLRNE
ncbi:ABC transporter permease [Rhodocytophaga aerolata]|uniref:ABC transporter permease n=1 Tax=Rhodocytophaga aerolata TaxID=455078 RepID=A0ABT8R9K9_9BACT|nr:ABC transporter permease [Rhodocytophaga aerolata]MDO1447370.1 ABC transporter permease [Rhodocytophaga aerolata]